MFEPLVAVIAGDSVLRQEQLALIESVFVPRRIEKGRFFQRGGTVAARGGFVVKGCFRTYFERLLDAIPQLARNYRMGLQRSQAAAQRRITQALHSSAEERYRDFVDRNPSLIPRIPQYMLASYLGITPETLSRIRSRHKPRPS